jgi:hypothetical protein
MRIRAAFCLTLCFACGESGDESAARPKTAAEVRPPEAQGKAALAAAPDPKCEDSPHFEDLEWLPESRFALLVAVQDGALSSTLSSFAEGGLDASPPLPVFARFELRNLALELRALALVYESLGVQPQQLLKVHGPKQESLWFLPAPCDHSALEARAAARWKVGFRGDGAARIGIAPQDAALPFDLIFLPGARMALVPRGSAGRVQSWLGGSTRTPEALTGDGSVEAAKPGDELTQIDAAPLRLRLSGRALGASGEAVDLMAIDAKGVHRPSPTTGMP